MQLKLRLLWFILLVIMALSAQPQKGTSATGLVFPLSGHPVRIQQIEELVPRSPDGSVEASRIHKTIYRDAEGRMRTEVQGAAILQRSSEQLITLVDPGEGVITALDPVHKIAVRMKAPTAGVDQFGLSLAGAIGPLPNTKWKSETTRLEKRTIEGIEFEGTRITNISQNDPALRIVSEWWTSKTLGLVGLATTVGPTGEHTARIERVDRLVPDPSLFVVPAEYLVQDVNMEGPQSRDR